MLAFLVLTSLAFQEKAGAEKNPLFEELLAKGLALPEHDPVKLPAPLMSDALTAKEQIAIVKKAGDKHQYKEFTRKSDLAPVAWKMSSIEGNDKERKGQTVDFYFVAYGSIKAATNTDALDKLLGNQAKAFFLSAEQLAKRKIALTGTKVDEKYTLINFELLDKVQVSGVGHAMKTSDGNSLISAVRLDPRFISDKEFPNQWRAINKPGGAKQLGPPQPYSGFGGYIKVTELKEPKGALFVEFHMVLCEPREWFEGRNLLRSKLPLAITERVRSFRRLLR